MSRSYDSLITQFKGILRTYGQDVYLRRRCTHCTQSGDRAKYSDSCTYCGGTGYLQTLERYTMRKMIIGNQFSFPSGMGLRGSGIILSEGIYFFAEAPVNPKYGDLIYDWNNGTASWEIYEINKALERRYDNRVLFWTCAGQIREGGVSS